MAGYRLRIKPSAVKEIEARVIHAVNDAHQTIDIIKVGHRGEVYRRTS